MLSNSLKKTLRLQWWNIIIVNSDNFVSYMDYVLFYIWVGETPGVGALQAFIEAVQASPSQEEVSFVMFEEYYEGLSISIDDDTDFATVLHNTWNIWWQNVL